MCATLMLALLPLSLTEAPEHPVVLGEQFRRAQEAEAAVFRTENLWLTEKRVVERRGPPSRKEGNVWYYETLRIGLQSFMCVTALTFRDGRVADARRYVRPYQCIYVKPVREK